MTNAIRPRSLLVIALAWVAILGWATSDAAASHYRLPVDNLIGEQETEAFRRAGVTTTLELLDAIATTAGREKTSQATGLSLSRLTIIAAQVDLLRIDGLGPRMVRLLQAAGVRHTRELGTSQVDDLARRVEAANGVHRVTPVVPSKEILEDWIQQARKLKPLVEGLI